MLSLALETSQRAASVAMQHDGDVTEQHVDPERAHASDLLPLAASWFEERNISPAELDAVFVGTGPGSYTGLRIGIATALGLARGANAVLRGVPSGEVLCWRELQPGQEAIYLLDGRQSEVYFAHYRREERAIHSITAPCVLKLEELASHLPTDLPIFGDAKALELAGLEELVEARLRAVAPANALALSELGQHLLEDHGPQAFDAVEPLYLRPFAAKIRKR